MKRFTLAIILLLVTLTASAQKLGVTGGLTLSQLENIKESRNAGYNAGVSLNIPLVLGLSLQPELIYNVKGATLPDVPDTKYTAGYCELGLQAQWGLDLIVAKPFVLLEPYVGGSTRKTLLVQDQSFKADLGGLADRLECGLAVGGGIEILSRLQLAVKYFRTLGTLLGSDGNLNPSLGSSASGQVSDILNGVGYFTGTTVSLTYFF
ncbi:MAG: PorT family protein [Bacteroidales bacterium]|nr:PorT family protein [Bacteroidales bacterium]